MSTRSTSGERCPPYDYPLFRAAENLDEKQSLRKKDIHHSCPTEDHAMLNDMKNHFLSFIGLESNTTSHLEKLVSVVGGFAGIFMVILTSGYFVGMNNSALLVASMGASAVS